MIKSKQATSAHGCRIYEYVVFDIVPHRIRIPPCTYKLYKLLNRSDKV